MEWFFIIIEVLFFLVMLGLGIVKGAWSIPMLIIFPILIAKNYFVIRNKDRGEIRKETASVELQFPVEYICPNCKTKWRSSLKLLEWGNAPVSVLAGESAAKETAALIAQQRALHDLRQICQGNTEKLYKLVSQSDRNCSKCKQEYPWAVPSNPTDKLESFTMYVTLALILVAVIWGVSMLATGDFHVAYLFYLPAAAGIIFLLFFLLGKISARKEKQQKEERDRKLLDVPKEYLPKMIQTENIIRSNAGIEWIDPKNTKADKEYAEKEIRTYLPNFDWISFSDTELISDTSKASAAEVLQPVDPAAAKLERPQIPTEFAWVQEISFDKIERGFDHGERYVSFCGKDLFDKVIHPFLNDKYPIAMTNAFYDHKILDEIERFISPRPYWYTVKKDLLKVDFDEGYHDVSYTETRSAIEYGYSYQESTHDGGDSGGHKWILRKPDAWSGEISDSLCQDKRYKKIELPSHKGYWISEDGRCYMLEPFSMPGVYEFFASYWYHDPWDSEEDEDFILGKTNC